MIDDIEQILVDSLTLNVPPHQLRQAAKEIDELVRARTLPVYLRLCTMEWMLQQAMIGLANLRKEVVAQENLKKAERD